MLAKEYFEEPSYITHKSKQTLSTGTVTGRLWFKVRVMRNLLMLQVCPQNNIH